jgi:cytochrome d ubiquinol oxidase subunit II
MTMPIVSDISFDLTTIWAFVIAFAVLTYVVLDGFDLGLGILFATERRRRDRDVMMNSVAPVWDGNETWLVLGGGGLFAAFPLAYSVILPALYAPLVAMLLALILRGVSFEFRWKAQGGRWIWDAAFIAGSTIASFMQGVALGALLQGITVDKAARAYAGGWWDWFTPFSAFVGLAVVVGYALLGATWLVSKTTGDLQERMRRRAWFLGLATVGFIAAVSLWSPFLQDGYFYRWFEGTHILWAAGVAALVAGLTWALFHALHVHRHDHWPFRAALGLFVVSFIGLGLTMYPYIIPTEITIYEAAAPRASQVFMLVGAGVLIPVILAYTAYAYYVFRGKIDEDTGYH